MQGARARQDQRALAGQGSVAPGDVCGFPAVLVWAGIDNFLAQGVWLEQPQGNSVKGESGGCRSRGCTSGPSCLSQLASGCFQPQGLCRGISLSPPPAAKPLRLGCGLVSGSARRASRQEALPAWQDLGVGRQTSGKLADGHGGPRQLGPCLPPEQCWAA